MNLAVNTGTPPVDANLLKSMLQQHLGNDLHSVNQILNSRLRSSSGFVNDVTEHVSRFRGKQIRPMLLLLTHRMLNGDDRASAAVLAAVVEMIHTATLVHDDVIDDADTRRHLATVHRRWNTETSVLLGDYLFSKAFHLAASTGDAEACRLIGLATDKTCEGELNQTAARLDRSTSEFDYFRIIRDKTGQLFALSCLLGARTAKATESQQRAAGKFGLRLGLAFQIADDVLDLSESHSSTGKDEGNDLQNGRLTLPLLRSLQLADPEEREELLSLIFQHPISAVDDLRNRGVVQRGIESASATAAELCRRAVRSLVRFPESADRELLSAIAMFAGQRQA
ncbi:MAG: polyprenyl synthetase family protein [Planctomycetaceae bacterium]